VRIGSYFLALNLHMNIPLVMMVSRDASVARSADFWSRAHLLVWGGHRTPSGTPPLGGPRVVPDPPDPPLGGSGTPPPCFQNIGLSGVDPPLKPLCFENPPFCPRGYPRDPPQGGFGGSGTPFSGPPETPMFSKYQGGSV